MLQTVCDARFGRKKEMQATLDIPTTLTPPISQADAQRTANTYLLNTLGAEYCAVSGAYENGLWSFLIHCHQADVNQPCIVGRVSVAAHGTWGRGGVIPLTEEQIREVRECANWEAARVRGELARDEHGCVSRHQARRLARRWLDQHVAMKYDAGGGIFIPLDSPVWQFSINFNLRDFRLEPLGVIDVDAQTGDVKPLSNDQIQTLRERVRAIIQSRQSSAAG